MKHIIAATCGLLMACSTASAADFADKDGIWWELIMPAPYWSQRPPLAEIKVIYIPRPATAQWCEQATGKPEQFGCMDFRGKYCVVVITDDMPEPFRIAVLEHEVAHCRGWPGTHPLD
tara:strand:- start:75 stop:428 length:354 start_codon:yes stop_codon:yes gene_type:complete